MRASVSLTEGHAGPLPCYCKLLSLLLNQHSRKPRENKAVQAAQGKAQGEQAVQAKAQGEQAMQAKMQGEQTMQAKAHRKLAMHGKGAGRTSYASKGAGRTGRAGKGAILRFESQLRLISLLAS